MNYTWKIFVNSSQTSDPNAVFWVGGDANLPDINWCDGSIAGHSTFEQHFFGFLS